MDTVRCKYINCSISYCLFSVMYTEYRSKLYKVVHQLSLMNPRTAANEALVALQELVQKSSNDGL